MLGWRRGITLPASERHETNGTSQRQRRDSTATRHSNSCRTTWNETEGVIEPVKPTASTGCFAWSRVILRRATQGS